jgi:hypothetical protein
MPCMHDAPVRSSQQWYTRDKREGAAYRNSREGERARQKPILEGIARSRRVQLKRENMYNGFQLKGSVWSLTQESVIHQSGGRHL